MSVLKLYVVGESSGNPAEWDGISWDVPVRLLVLAKSVDEANEIVQQSYGYVGEVHEVDLSKPCVLSHEEMCEAVFGEDL